MQDSEVSNSKVNRQKRFASHALVEVRKYRWFPFGIHSAVLLDISLGGFKLEFTGNHTTKVGERYWINIPLAPLGIHGPSQLICQAECRWFDNGLHRLGGVFMELDESDKLIIEQVVETLSSRGVANL